MLQRKFPSALLAGMLAAGLLSPSPAALAGGTLRVAMTASDVPITTGAPDNGYEGMRFLGFPVFEGLILWDLSQADKLADIRPGLAEKWEQDKEDKAKWIFHLRRGVKFHDGSDFNADAAIWNLDRYYKKESPQYDPPGAAVAQARDPFVAGYRKIDDYTIEITNPRPLSYFPYMLPYMLYSSPAQFAKTGSWAEFAKAPSGTGPFKITDFKPRISATLSRNEDYWDKNKVPKLDKMILFPMPEATTRLAALRSGQVDWIEVPPPDAVPSLKSAGFEIVTGSYPHVWPWTLNLGKPDAPWGDVRVRRALNYCINRDGLVSLLNGLAEPSVGIFKPSDPYFGRPTRALYIRPGQSESASERGRLRPRQAGQGQGDGIDQRLWTDAPVADERVPAAERQGVRFRRLVRGRRLGRDACRSAQHADRAAGDGRRRDEYQSAALGGYLADGAVLSVGQCAAEGAQLVELEECAIRRVDRPHREILGPAADRGGCAKGA